MKIVLSLACLMMLSCASTHPGNYGELQGGTQKLPLKISAESIDPRGDDPFQLIEFTFENTSANWLRIAKVDLPEDDPSVSKISVVVGRDLVDWANAMNYRLKQERQNTEVIQASLILAGSAAAAGSKNKDAAVAGAALATTGYVWAVSDIVRASVRNAQKPEQLAENHLYHSVSIPGKMFTKKWVVLNKPVGQMVSQLYVEVETINGEKEAYVIKM